MTQPETKAQIQEINWSSASKSVKKANPSLWKAINDWNPGPKYKLFRVHYPFAAQILKEGMIQFPLSNKELVSINDPRIPQTIKNELNYNFIPLGLIIDKKIEVYKVVDIIEERVVPIALLYPGLAIGLLEVMDPPVSFCARHTWDAVAGGRSLYMLPKITNTRSFQSLRNKYGISSHVPRRHIDHWKVFQELSNSNDFSDDWSLEIIFFGKEWFKPIDNIGYLKFIQVLQQRVITGSGYYRNQLSSGIMWQSFAKILAKRRQRPDTYLFDTLKHIVAIVSGVVPGFRPINDDNNLGPIEHIKEIFVEDYGLEYAPTIFGPCAYNYHNDETPLYYSLQIPTLLESMPKFVPTENLLADLILLKDLITMFTNAANNDKLNIAGTIIDEALKTVSFDYFHLKADSKNNIKATESLPGIDLSLTIYQGKQCKLPFTANSKFLKGCIQIHK